MSSKGRNREDRCLQNFKKFVKKAENADSAGETEDWLSKAAVWAEKLAERKSGEEAEKWRQLAEKTEHKIEKQGPDLKKRSQDRSSNNKKRRQKNNTGSAGGEGPAEFTSPPQRSFDDIGGMDDIIAKLKDRVIYQMQDSPYRDPLGVSPTNCVLFHGPPGTGKTYISKILAAVLGYRYAEVSASDLFNRYVGETGKAVKALFNQIHDNKPCVIFIDEFESIGSNRQNLEGEGGDKAYQQAVTELLQGLENLQGSDAVVIAATNILDQVDGAILRSGRFDEKIHIGPPDKEARKEILQVHLRERATEGSFNWDKLAEITEDFSAADLEKVVRYAGQQAHRQSLEQDSLQPITSDHVISEIRETEPSLKHWNQEK